MSDYKSPVFSRPPRFFPYIPKGEIEIPDPPSVANKPEISWVTMLLPPGVMLIITVIIAMNSQSLYMMLSIATTIVTLFCSMLGATTQIRKYKREKKLRNKKYLQAIADIRSELKLAKEQQIAAMNEINPPPEICLERINKMDSKVWERTPAYSDFLMLRLGIGSVPAYLKTTYTKKQITIESDPLEEEPKKLSLEFEKINNLPVSIDVFGLEVMGLVGSNTDIKDILNVLALQIITHHSYDDVKIVLLLNEEQLAWWDWAKYLPHLWNEDFSARFMLCGKPIAHMMLGHLYNIFKERELRQSKSDYVMTHLTHYIFIVGDSTLLENEAINKYLYNGYSNIGISSVFIAERKEYLPMNCKGVVELIGKKGTYINRTTLEQLTFTVDKVETSELEKAARIMAPYRIKKSEASFSLPKSITLLEMLKTDRVDKVDVLSRWTNNKTYKDMGVPIGVRAGGELFYLDMQAYETSHGPHGLVAGTTGSGKSELLQSIIISLAINFHPHDVVFVLIDYKGGGMADVFKGMPHLVGTITNLGGNQTNRALVSIKSELKRRQQIFAKYEVNNIDKYQKLYHAGGAKEALPHLIMIADEFAELKAEQPDFMKELVSTARVGRSLGVHLILATQKPAGVVDDQIWSNSRFKICLKVQDESDSRDVIKRPDAALIKEPGRAYIQVGNDEIFEMFQSTWSGADYDPDGKIREQKNKVPKLYKLGLEGKTTKIFPLGEENLDQSEKDSQLKAMVMHIINKAKEANIEPLEGPWLPPLQETLYLDDIMPIAREKITSIDTIRERHQDELVVAVGMIDNPSEQNQGPLELNFSKEGNLLVYGSPGTGKTTLLETMMLSVALNNTPDDVHIYIMDFGGGVLKKYEKLPHCGGVMGIEDEVKINQFMLFIFRIIEQRKTAFAEYGVANRDVYNQVAKEKFPAIMLLIDNYFALSETYETVDEQVMLLSREGAKYGIYLITTATNPTLIRYKFSVNFKMALTLRLTDKSEYASIVGRTDGLEPDNVLGRGLVKIASPVEFQTAMPQLNDKSTLELIKEFADIPDISYALQIPEMPENVDILKLNCDVDQNTLMIGLKQDDLQPLAIDLRSNPVIAITGDIQSGKSTLLEAWVKALLKKMGEDKLQVYAYDSNNMGLYHMMQYPCVINLREEDTEEIIDGIRSELELRQQEANECRREGRDITTVYNEWKQIVIVIDNIIEFAENDDYMFKEFFEFLIKKSYGMKILIVAAGLIDEWTNNWDPVPKALKDIQTGIILGSIKEQSFYNVRVPYGYYEKELSIGEGYFVSKGKYSAIKVACCMHK